MVQALTLHRSKEGVKSDTQLTVNSLSKFRLSYFCCLQTGIRKSQWWLYFLPLNPWDYSAML